MKHHPYLLESIFFTAFILASGCTTTNTTQVIEVQPPSTGRIEGSVQLWEMDCTPSASFDGVTVNLLGTSHTTTTDSSGHFALDSVPAGYYTIHYSKAGFADYYSSQIAFVGGGIFPTAGAALSRIRNWTTTLYGATVIKQLNPGSTDSVNFYVMPTNPLVVDSSGKQQPANLFYFFGKDTGVNYLDTATWITYAFSLSGTGRTIIGNRVHSGDTLYMVAYPAACYYPGPVTYYVGDTVKTAFPGLGPPSNVVSFVLP